MSILLPTVRAQLCTAAARLAQEPEGRAHGRLRMPRRLRGGGRGPLVAIAIGVLLLAGAFGGALIELGKPAPSTTVFSNPTAELGALTPGAVRMLPVSTSDPAGGPPWGMRVLSTTRGVGCIQVGRIVEGKLGALGQDGAFGNDGQFHELPDGGSFDQFSCAALDGAGRLFNNVTQGEEPASASWLAREECLAAGTIRFKENSKLPTCPQADERNLYYGLLGPDAESVTYSLEGHSHTIPTVGADGAYLIVTRAPAKQLLGFSGATTADVVPVDGPITELHYRDGSTCHLTSRSWIGGASACSPSLSVPVGYTPVAPPPTAAQLATPLQGRVVASPHGGREVLLSFTSRVAVTSDRGEYQLHVAHLAGVSPQDQPAGMMLNRDIAAGEQVTMHIGAPGGQLPAGDYTGTVTYVYATGPALLEGPGTVYVPVGSFTLHVR
jgi:hypothetical protein